MTMRQIGVRERVNDGRIAQIQKSALSKLASLLRAKGMGSRCSA